MRWPSAGQTIANLVERRAGSTHLSDLSPAQLEVICSELMRLPDAELLGLPTLASLLLPAGGTMKDIDIYGLATDGKQIFAQVTYSNASEAAWKADRLRPYLVTGDAHGILFCQTDAISRQDGLLTFPIEIAATAFRHSAIGKQWYLSAGK